jgi:Fe-S-cluster containining protein
MSPPEIHLQPMAMASSNTPPLPRPSEQPIPTEPPVTGKYYTRTGGCTECGKCCTDIYLLYDERTIETIEEFDALRADNPDFDQFKPLETTAKGVVFACRHLGEDNRCTTYEQRPTLCRLYPSEDMMLRGGYLPEECGYVFTLRQTFSQVLKTAQPKVLPLQPVVGQ